MNSSTFESQRQDSLKRIRWQQDRTFPFPNINNTASRFVAAHSSALSRFDDDLVSRVVPPVTVVLEGRSICQRISLHNHAGYHSLAKALRQMFVQGEGGTMIFRRRILIFRMLFPVTSLRMKIWKTIFFSLETLIGSM